MIILHQYTKLRSGTTDTTRLLNNEHNNAVNDETHDKLLSQTYERALYTNTTARYFASG